MCVFGVHSEVHTCVFGTMLYSEVNTCVVLAQDVTWRQSVSSKIDSISSTWRTFCPCLRVHINTLHIDSKFYSSLYHSFNPAYSMTYTVALWLRPNLSHTTGRPSLHVCSCALSCCWKLPLVFGPARPYLSSPILRVRAHLLLLFGILFLEDRSKIDGLFDSPPGERLSSSPSPSI